jgi:uncharacterized protein (TIGR02594 family)
VADHVWDKDAISKRCGCVAMLKTLIELGEVSFDNAKPNPVPTLPDNKLEIISWKISETDTRDARGFNADGKCVCYLDTNDSIDTFRKAITLAGAPRARLTFETLPEKTKPVPKPDPVPSSTWKELKKGSQGEKVKELQKALNSNFGAKLTADGDFGAKTEGAVKLVEAILNIPMDGMVTENDWELIKSYVAPTNTGSRNPNLDCVKEATKWIGVHEQGGNNNGPEVAKFQKAVDGKAGSEAWCMAFVQFCIKEVEESLGIKSLIKRSEHCLTTYNESPDSIKVKVPEAGCIVIWQHGTTSNGHTGFVTGINPEGKLLTIEGNTDAQDGMNRDGNGVFARVRNNGPEGDMKIKGFIKVF